MNKEVIDNDSTWWENNSHWIRYSFIWILKRGALAIFFMLVYEGLIDEFGETAVATVALGTVVWYCLRDLDKGKEEKTEN